MDVDTVRHALTVARRHGFAEVELRAGRDRFRARLEAASATPKIVALEVDSEPKLAEIRSPLVGYYRAGRSPLAVGKRIVKGDAVASVEALGLLSDVESKHSGEVVELLVEEGQPLQYGQVIARVQP